MAFTGKLGTAESYLANVILGGGEDGFSGTIDAVNTFSFVQTAVRVGEVQEVDAANVFNLDVSIEHNQQSESIVQSLSFVSRVGQDVEADIIQYLGLTTREVVDVINTFSWENIANPVEEHSATNTFDFDQNLFRIFLMVQSLSLDQSVVANFVQNVSNDLNLQYTLTDAGTEYERDDVQHCIKQYVTYSVSGDKCREKNYNPLVGEGDDGYDAMPTTPPVLTKGTLTLTYPYVTPTTTLVFKNPAFGNDHSLDFSVINRETRGGDRIVFADPDWAKTELQTLSIENVCESLRDNFVSFVNESLGKEIGLLDWEGRQWRGIIVAPESPIESTRTGFRVGITFQGVLV